VSEFRLDIPAAAHAAPIRACAWMAAWCSAERRAARFCILVISERGNNARTCTEDLGLTLPLNP